MQTFLVGHATHPDWRAALALVAAQLDGQRRRARGEASDPSLGFVYFSDHYAAHAGALFEALRQRWPGVAWVGTVGVGVAASGVEYFDEPALVLMLAALPQGRFQVFSGARPLARIEAHTALIHADGNTPDLADLIDDMSARTGSGYLFGGLSSSRGEASQIAEGVFRGGLSGVAFGRDVAVVSRVTQGCQPVGPVRRISACERNLVTGLDGEPALACLLRDTGISLDEPQSAMHTLRGTLVGLSQAREALLARGGQFGTDTRVRHLIGLDPGRQGVAIADVVEPGMQLAFCQRDVQAARRDLVRVCAEIRDALSPEAVPSPAPVAPAPVHAASAPVDPAARIAGAIYISCAGRGGPHFGAPSAELQIVQRELGDVPLVGFFAAGEIGHHHLYGYTGVLTVFTREH
ncbi:MAG: FIST N-terminal domain-containing protein [Pseudomonadota bacterium]